MKYFKDANNKVFALQDDGSQNHLIKSEMTEVTESEAKEVIQSAINASLSIEQILNNKQVEIVQKFKASMSLITASYTAEDIASFPVQEAEAKAWDADKTAETPLLDFMVANRLSVDKAALVSRILANSVIYKQVAGPAIGKKQHFEDLLYALKTQHEDPEQPDVTQADIDAIVVDFSTI